jgi:hypothetical protein
MDYATRNPLTILEDKAKTVVSVNADLCALTWLTGNPYKCEVNGDQLCDTEADPNLTPNNSTNVTDPRRWGIMRICFLGRKGK